MRRGPTMTMSFPPFTRAVKQLMIANGVIFLLFALLGAFAALTQFVHIDSVNRAIEDAFPGRIGTANIAAATDAYEFVLSQQHAASAA